MLKFLERKPDAGAWRSLASEGPGHHQDCLLMDANGRVAFGIASVFGANIDFIYPDSQKPPAGYTPVLWFPSPRIPKG